MTALEARVDDQPESWGVRRRRATPAQGGARPSRAQVKVGRARVDAVSFDQAVEQICDLAAEPGWAKLVVTPNIQHVVELERNEPFRDAYDEACLTLPDGWPVAMAARWAGAEGQARVAGADLFPAVCRAAAARGLTVGMMGGQPGTMPRCLERLATALPDLDVVFAHEAPMGFDQSTEAINEILAELANSRPNILFVGVGAPRQEMFVQRHRPEANVVVGVGAALEFYAGLRPRAPSVLQRLGLEWLFRLGVEPRRLWRRYAEAAPGFVRVVARDYRVRSRSSLISMSS